MLGNSGIDICVIRIWLSHIFSTAIADIYGCLILLMFIFMHHKFLSLLFFSSLLSNIISYFTAALYISCRNLNHCNLKLPPIRFWFLKLFTIKSFYHSWHNCQLQENEFTINDIINFTCSRIIFQSPLNIQLF